MKSNVYLGLLAATFFWALNFHLAKQVPASFPFQYAILVRYGFASLLFVIFNPLSITALAALLKQKGRPLLVVSATGIFGYSVLFFLAMPYTSAVNAALIMALSPALTVAFSALLLKTQVSRLQVAGLTLSLGGVLLVIAKGDWSTLASLHWSRGDLLLLVDSALFAFSNVYNKKHLSGTDSRAVAGLTTHLATILCCLLVALCGSPVPLQAFTTSTVVSLLTMAALGSYLAYRFWYRSIAAVGADRSSYFLNLIPLFATIIGLALGQPVTAVQWAGGAILISGVFLSSFQSRFHARQKAILVGCKN